MSKSPENPATNTSENPVRNSSFQDREREIEKKLQTGILKKPSTDENTEEGVKYDNEEIKILMQGVREIHRVMEENGGNLPEIHTGELYSDFD